MIVSRVNLYYLELLHWVIHVFRQYNFESAKLLWTAHRCNEFGPLLLKSRECNFETTHDTQSLHSCIETCLIESFDSIKFLQLGSHIRTKLVWYLGRLLRHHTFLWIGRYIVWIQSGHYIFCWSSSLSHAHTWHNRICILWKFWGWREVLLLSGNWILFLCLVLIE